MPQSLRFVSPLEKAHPTDDSQRTRGQASDQVWRRPANPRCLYPAQDPERYRAVAFHAQGRTTNLEEKPASPKSQNSYGQYAAVELSAHGFVVLSDTAEFLYKTTDYWTLGLERSIAWNDPAIGIQWPIQGEPSLAVKDLQAKASAEAEHCA